MKPRPLTGLRILDFTRVYSGPLATLMLSDLGAEVIKVERPGQGDDSRSFGPLVGGTSGYFETLNRNKKSLAVDFRRPDGQRLLRRLLKDVDGLVENFRPGQMAKFGLDYGSLQDDFPDLVYVSLSGFGQDNPSAARGCYDIVAQAESGLMGLTGQPDLPMKTGPAVADALSGLTAAVGMLAALLGRERGKGGAHVDVAMVDSVFACLENSLAMYSATGQIPQRQGNSDAVLAPFDAFQAEDGWIVIATGNDAQWQALARLMGPGWIEDPRFATNQQRLAHSEALHAAIQTWCQGQASLVILDRLHQAGLPAGSVRGIDELSSDPRLEARGMLARIALADGSALLVPGSPIRLEDTGKIEYRRGPRLGEHTHVILANYASQAELAEWQAAGLIQT